MVDMKYFFTLLLCLTIIKSVNADPPDRVTFQKTSLDADDFEININLKRIQSFVANEYLPVWVVDSGNPKDLRSLENMMSDIGPFYMYQSLRDCSAAVYFEEGQHFDGTNGHQHSMKTVLHNSTNIITPIKESNLFTSTILDHETNLDLRARISENVEIRHGKQWKYIKSLIERPEIVYIETLVMINYDLVNAFYTNYEKIISEVIVSMNSVDMLFSQIKSPEIRINIAGIIIGSTRGSFPSIQKCFKSVRHMNVLGYNEKCVIKTVRMTLDNYHEKIPLNSFDIVVFLTNYKLYEFVKYADGEIVADEIYGIADPPSQYNDFIGYTLSSADVPVTIIQRFNSFAYYPSIAHEMAHLFHVLHEPGRFRSSYGECTGNLMRSDGGFCRKCIFFGDIAQKQMLKYFMSRDGCKFRNKPWSLSDPSKPRLFWNEQQQCKCYGFPRAMKSQKVDCHHQKRLECVDSRSIHHETGIFMHGTPCGRHQETMKVCWNGKCQEIQN